MIPDYAKRNFIINENDTPEQVLAKQYHLNKDMSDRKYHAEQQLAKLNKRLQNFEEKYREIMRLKKDTTTQGLLELQLAIEELIENK